MEEARSEKATATAPPKEGARPAPSAQLSSKRVSMNRGAPLTTATAPPRPDDPCVASGLGLIRRVTVAL